MRSAKAAAWPRPRASPPPPGLGLFLAPEYEVHGQPDRYAESHRADGTRGAQFHPQNPRGHDDGQDVDGRAGVEERRGRAKPCPAHPDAAEQRQHRAGTHRQDRPGDRSHSVSHRLVRLGPQVAHDGRLVDERADGSGDEQRRDQAKEDMLLRVPFGQLEAFLEGVVEAGHPTGRKKIKRKQRQRRRGP
jgi:hypothetical protein